jgi:G-protein alpha subunit
MAVCGLACFMSEETKVQQRTNREIERQLEKDKAKYKRTMKILLLGSGESGKSTFLKQMRIIHGSDFVSDELKQYKLIIYGNVVKGMRVLIDARDKLHIPFSDKRNADAASFIFGYDVNVKLEEPVFLQFVPAIYGTTKE